MFRNSVRNLKTHQTKKIIKTPRQLIIPNNKIVMQKPVIKDYNINIKNIDISGLIVDNKLGFVILRNVRCVLTNNYWKESYNCIREFYPNNKILIVDDNSNYNFINLEDESKLQNCEIIKSEYKGRGELLPYYYFYKTKFVEKMVFIHDSVFIKKYINFSDNDNVRFLWEFNACNENKNTEILYLNQLNNNKKLINMFNSNYWKGCFGVMSVIKLDFLNFLVDKYNFFKLIDFIKSRSNRSCLERVFAVLCFTENNYKTTYFGNIFNHSKWGFNFAEYIANKNSKKDIVKVWTGR